METKVYERLYERFPTEISECGSKFGFEQMARKHKLEIENGHYK